MLFSHSRKNEFVAQKEAVNVTIWGPPRAGKTVLLVALYDRYKGSSTLNRDSKVEEQWNRVSQRKLLPDETVDFERFSCAAKSASGTDIKFLITSLAGQSLLNSQSAGDRDYALNVVKKHETNILVLVANPYLCNEALAQRAFLKLITKLNPVCQSFFLAVSTAAEALFGWKGDNCQEELIKHAGEYDVWFREVLKQPQKCGEISIRESNDANDDQGFPTNQNVMRGIQITLENYEGPNPGLYKFDKKPKDEVFVDLLLQIAKNAVNDYLGSVGLIRGLIERFPRVVLFLSYGDLERVIPCATPEDIDSIKEMFFQTRGYRSHEVIVGGNLTLKAATVAELAAEALPTDDQSSKGDGATKQGSSTGDAAKAASEKANVDVVKSARAPQNRLRVPSLIPEAAERLVRSLIHIAKEPQNALDSDQDLDRRAIADSFAALIPIATLITLILWSSSASYPLAPTFGVALGVAAFLAFIAPALPNSGFRTAGLVRSISYALSALCLIVIAGLFIGESSNVVIVEGVKKVYLDVREAAAKQALEDAIAKVGIDDEKLAQEILRDPRVQQFENSNQPLGDALGQLREASRNFHASSLKIAQQKAKLVVQWTELRSDIKKLVESAPQDSKSEAEKGSAEIAKLEDTDKLDEIDALCHDLESKKGKQLFATDSTTTQADRVSATIKELRDEMTNRKNAEQEVKNRLDKAKKYIRINDG